MVLGSRRAKSSSGFVSADTYSLPYSPGLSVNFCTTDNGATTASSSAPPDDKMPVACNVSQCFWSKLTLTLSPIFIAFFSANLVPTTHSAAPGRNHCPSTRHQGFVFSRLLAKLDPSGSGKE